MLFRSVWAGSEWRYKKTELKCAILIKKLEQKIKLESENGFFTLFDDYPEVFGNLDVDKINYKKLNKLFYGNDSQAIWENKLNNLKMKHSK